MPEVTMPDGNIKEVQEKHFEKGDRSRRQKDPSLFQKQQIASEDGLEVGIF